MKKAKKAVRLSSELDAIEGAVSAAWLLAEGLRTDQFGETHHFDLVPKAMAGVLALVSARLRQVGAILHGARSPKDILASHNSAEADDEEDGRDLLLIEGDPSEKA